MNDPITFSGKSQIHPFFFSSEDMVRKDSCLCVGLFMLLIILNTQASALTDALDGTYIPVPGISSVLF